MRVRQRALKRVTLARDSLEKEMVVDSDEQEATKKSGKRWGVSAHRVLVEKREERL
jgi:hypothetical protein